MYRLYPITDKKLSRAKDVLEDIKSFCCGGVKIIQLRDKDLSDEKFKELAVKALNICRKYKVKLIINDRIKIAKSINADGIHIGQEDLKADKKNLTVSKWIVGVSVQTKTQAIEAERFGATYIAASAIFTTQTKLNAKVIGLKGLKKIKKEVSIPIVAIGGIHQDNMRQVFSSGADGVAMISEIITAENVEWKVRELIKKIEKIKKSK